MSILTVGSGQQFARLADAIAVSRDGDVIRAQAGTYVNDFATISTRITIEGVGGMVKLVATQQPPNGKAILTTTTDVTLDHVELSGSTVPSGNGAGIRHENGALTLKSVYIHHNQNGILAGANLNSSITITNSEFAFNGAGDGQTHGLYANEIQSLTIRDSYFHDVSVGHEIKSRAFNTLIENSRIMSGSNGNDSYAIDMPNGGAAVLRNNVIVEGAQSQNSNTIHYGGEGGPHPGSSLQISGNILVNDRSSVNLLLNVTGVTATMSSNQVFGARPDQVSQGPVNVSGTTFLASRPAVDTSPVSFATNQPAPTPGPVVTPTPAPEPVVTPAPAPVPTTGPDTLVLQLSEDAYQGNAWFVASVDGVELGAAQEVTALHGNGQSQAFTFKGSFGSGAHTVSVRFLNDAYGGTPSTDRNLYVDGITFNGTQYPNAKAALLSAGTSNFSVGGAASTVSGSSTPTVQPGSYTLEGPTWANKTITWAFGTRTYAQDASNPFSNPIGSAYQATIQQAMQTWASVSGLTFKQVADTPDANGAASIRIGFADLNAPATNVVGATSYRYSISGASKSFLPDVVVRIQDPSKVALAPGANGNLQYQGFSTTLYQVALHEIGHAIGLGHSNDATSIMSPSLGSQNRTLNASDSAGIQSLYGAPSGVVTANGSAADEPPPLVSSAPEEAVFHGEQGSYVSIDGRAFGGALTAGDYDALGLSGSMAFSGHAYADSGSVQPEAGESLAAAMASSPWQNSAAPGWPAGSGGVDHASHDHEPVPTSGIVTLTDYTMGQVLPILQAA